MLLLCVKPVLLLVCVVWVMVGLGGLEPVLVLGAKGQEGSAVGFDIADSGGPGL